MKEIARIFSSDKNNRRILMAVLLLLFGGLGIGLNVTYITDETGTMANAAYLAGYDWSVFVDNTGNYYYKYGQALFWYPVFALVKDSFLVYKLLMLEHAVMLALESLCIYKILRWHLRVANAFQAFLLTLIATVTPPAVLYSMFARADVILVSFSVYVLYFILESWDHRGNAKRQALDTLFAVLCMSYLYMCHSRGIVWVIAVTMVAVTIHFYTKEKMVNYWVYVGALGILLVTDHFLAAFFKENIWGAASVKNSVESFNFETLGMIFTANGIKTMVKLAAGWLYNFMGSSMGMALAGLLASVVVIWMFFWKKPQIKPQEAILCGYGFLIFAGSMAMGMLFFFSRVYKNYYAGVGKRVDRLVYDRYLAGSVVVAVLIGLYFFLYRKDIFQKLSRSILVGVSVFLLCFYKFFISKYMDYNEFSARNSIASNLFLWGSKSGHDAGKFDHMSAGLFLCGLFAVIVLAVFLVVSQRKAYRKWLLYGVAVLFLASLLVNYKKMRISTDRNVVAKVQGLNDYAKEIRILPKDKRNILVDPSAPRLKPLQLVFKEFQVYVRGNEPKEDGIEEYFIVSGNGVFDPKLDEGDCYQLSDYDYGDAERYVIYVKGDGLKSELECMGKRLEPVTMR